MSRRSSRVIGYDQSEELENLASGASSGVAASNGSITTAVRAFWLLFAFAVAGTAIAGISVGVTAFLNNKSTQQRVDDLEDDTACQICHSNGTAQFPGGVVIGSPDRSAVLDVHGRLIVNGTVVSSGAIKTKSKVEAAQVIIDDPNGGGSISVGERLATLNERIFEIDEDLEGVCTCDQVDQRIVNALLPIDEELDALAVQIANITVDQNVTIISAQVALLTAEVNSLISNVSTVQTQVTTIEGDVVTLQNEVQLFEAWLASNITTLQTQINALENEVATNITSIETQISSLQVQLNLNVSTLQSMISLLQTQINANVTSLQAQLNAQNALITSVEGRVDVLNATVSAVQAALDALNATTTDVTSQIASLNATLTVALANISAAEMQLAALNASLASLDGFVNNVFYPSYLTFVASASTNISALQTTVASLVTSVTTLNSTLIALSSSVSSINSTLTTCCANRVSSLTAGQGIVVSAATGNVTVSAANVTANNTLLGRASPGAGPAQQISLANTLAMSGTTLSAIPPAAYDYVSASTASFTLSATAATVTMTQNLGTSTASYSGSSMLLNTVGMYLMTYTLHLFENDGQNALEVYIICNSCGGSTLTNAQTANGLGLFRGALLFANTPTGTTFLYQKSTPGVTILSMQVQSIYINGTETIKFGASWSAFRIF